MKQLEGVDEVSKPNERAQKRKWDWSQIDWPTSLFLIITPLLSIALAPAFLFSINGFDISILLFFWIASEMGITAGYHRLYAHRSYKASPWLKGLLLFMGTGAIEGPALKWCSDHRKHHRFVDTDQDPYNIKRGFFFAHVGWLLLNGQGKVETQGNADLLRDPVLQFQYRHYLILLIVTGFLIPTAIGFALGYGWEGFYFGSLLRIVLTQHCTFFINSLCHMWGSQPYTDQNSARDNLLLALVTNGEGYHNFHHRFEGDYRNGVRWYQWDPTKWLIRIASFLGLASQLRRIPRAEILAARMQNQHRLLARVGILSDHLENLRVQTERAMRRFEKLKIDCKSLKRRVDERAQWLRVKAETRQAKREFKGFFSQWADQVRVLRRSFEAYGYE